MVSAYVVNYCPLADLRLPIYDLIHYTFNIILLIIRERLVLLSMQSCAFGCSLFALFVVLIVFSSRFGQELTWSCFCQENRNGV